MAAKSISIKQTYKFVNKKMSFLSIRQGLSQQGVFMTPWFMKNT